MSGSEGLFPSSKVAPHRARLMRRPGARLKRYAPLEFVKSGAGGRKSGYAELNLTSMVDMLTILVVFLLQTFSASGELYTVQKNVTLPDAINYKDVEEAPVIVIAKDVVTLNGRKVADAEQLGSNDSSDAKITELFDDLTTLKNNFKLLRPTENFAGLVTVQADQNIDFKIMKKVLATCGLAGYQNISFLVRQKAKSAG